MAMYGKQLSRLAIGICLLIVGLVYIRVYNRVNMKNSTNRAGTDEQDKNPSNGQSLAKETAEKELYTGHISVEDVKRFTDNFWQQVNFTDSKPPYLNNVYLNRFYYDDRPKWKGFNKVIGFGSSARLESDTLICLLWTNRKNKPDEYGIKTVEATISNIKMVEYLFRGIEYVPYHIACSSPSKPDYVSLVYKLPPAGQVITNRDLQNIFDIYTPEKPATPASVSKTIGLCTHGLHGYIIDDAIPIFVQWIELHLMFGISKITMYNTTVIKYTDYFTKVIDYYKKQDNIFEFSQFPTIPPIKPPYQNWEEVEMAQQMVVRHSVMDCFYKNLYNYWYILYVDKDEIVYPHGCKLKTYSDCMTEKLKENKHYNKAPYFTMENKYHFYNISKYEEKDVSRNLPVLKYPTYTDDGVLYLRKSFSNPLYCDYLQQHGCLRQEAVPIHSYMMKIHHFRFTCQPKFACDQPNPKLEKDNFIQKKYKDEITKRTMKVLNAINFKNDMK